VTECLPQHPGVDYHCGRTDGEREQRRIQRRGSEEQGQRRSRVEKDCLLAAPSTLPRLPQAVRDDQPDDGRADRQHGEHKKAKPVQGIRQHPKVRGNEREDDRRCGGRQRPRESNDQAPGPVGADHAA
jgi:hypothetical protein